MNISFNYPSSAFIVPQVVEIFGIASKISFVLSCFSFPLMVYLILFQAKTMGYYKWFLLNCVCWGFLADLWLTLTQPITLSPMAAGYFNGPIANIVGGIPQFIILFSLYVQKSFALFLALIYRRAQLSLGRLNELFDKPKFLLFFAGFHHIVVNGIMITPVLFWVPEVRLPKEA